jgi:nicotinamidase-related amidase
MKTALIIVNFQRDYLEDGVLEIVGAEKLIPRIQKLQPNGPVIAVRNWFEKDTNYFGVENTPGAKIHPAIKKMSEYVVSVQTPGFSGFQGNTLRPIQSLEDLLGEHGVQHVVVCGLTDAVVFTALDSAALGYQTRVVKDASIFEADFADAFFFRAGVNYG